MCAPQRVASFLRSPPAVQIAGRGNLGLKFGKLRFHLSTPRISLSLKISQDLKGVCWCKGHFLRARGVTLQEGTRCL